jgi:type VI secretion system secreted protein VgrG
MAAPGERKASCPVRMMQPSAGPGYGMHFPLKPGVEVVIGFVDGNPDRPVILGAVPNPITPTPVDAAVSTKSRIQTRSGIIIEFDDADRG